MATIFLTGGSGFIGRNVIRALRARGDDVRALARSDASAATVRALGASVVIGDLDDIAAMQDGMAGADAVIHSAAVVGEWGPRELFVHGNVDGTRAVLTAAKAAGVPMLVHLSSEAVLADGRPLVRVDESRPIPPKPFPRYSATKAEAEQLVLAANTPGFATVALRPRFVWGADDTSLLPLVIDAVEHGRFMWIGGGRQLMSTCHVVNVVDGVLRALDAGRGGEVYFLTDGAPVEQREFLTRMLGTQGVTPPNRNVPRGMVRFIANVVEPLWDILHLPGRPPITRTVAYLFGDECTLVDDKARRELGYTSPMSVEEGLRDLAARRSATI